MPRGLQLQHHSAACCIHRLACNCLCISGLLPGVLLSQAPSHAFTPCAPFPRPSPYALPPCVRFQGLKGLRGLKVLRLAHNQLSSLEGLGQATQLEVLDATGNSLRNLAGGRWACGERSSGAGGAHGKVEKIWDGLGPSLTAGCLFCETSSLVFAQLTVIPPCQPRHAAPPQCAAPWSPPFDAGWLPVPVATTHQACPAAWP